jgi:hypothetical protein
LTVNIARNPDLTVKGGTAVAGTIVFKDSTGTAYAPGTSQTCVRTNVLDNTTATVTLTYSGTPAGGYTFTDTPPANPNQQLYLYEWKGLDGTKPPVTGEYLVLVTPTVGV